MLWEFFSATSDAKTPKRSIRLPQLDLRSNLGSPMEGGFGGAQWPMVSSNFRMLSVVFFPNKKSLEAGSILEKKGLCLKYC